MKSNYVLLSAGLIMLAMGCGSSEHQEKATTEMHAGYAAAATPLSMNGTEKWKADASTLDYVQQMEERVNGYLAAPVTDHMVLVGQLQADLSSLTAGCTMKGQAHDELHNWLLPYIGQVKMLAATEDPDTAQQIIKDLKAQLESFHFYFE